MEEQVARFIAPGPKLPLPPPASEASFFGWTRKNLFATPMDSVLTILGLVFIVWAGWNLIGWGITRAVFEGNDRTACLGQEEGDVGACWAFVKARFGQFVYGLYPTGERWRVDVIFALLAALLIPVAIPTIPYKRLNAILLLGVFPFVALVLLTGGEFDLSGGATALILTLTAIATLFLAGSRIDLGWESPWLRAAAVLVLLALAALIFSGDGGRGPTLLGIRFTTTSLLAFGAAALAIVAAAFAAATRIAGAGRGEALRTVLIPVAAFVAVLVALNADFGLPPVRTSLWGGLLVTLVVALSGIAASLPLGILLALGRRSEMPAIRLLCIIFIEFWRGVPLITVLFMANFMLPLLLPAGVSFDQLLRALVGVALFSAAYLAEVIRGGLQAIPKGQYEGADAMGLAYWQKMRMIILPQALKLVIPGIVNTFIGLFKDTSLVYIIGLADLLGTVRRGFSDPNWITPSTPATGLVFAAFVFWLFCFGMSRYSIFMERRLDTAQKH